MANIYGGIDLIGGGTGAIDKINGSVLNDKDMFLTIKNGILYPHWLDDDSGAGEDSPLIISPDLNAGTKRWLLSGIHVADVITKGPKLDIRAFLPFGYVTNGTVDYATEIQALIDEIKVVGNGYMLVPLGTFRVNTPLDCTGFLGMLGTTNRGLNIEGVSINGSRILGATSGKPIFDFTNSGYCSIDKLRITGHSSDTPNIALLLARNVSAASAGVHNFRRLFIEGYFTKGGIYNFTSEENHFDNIRITIVGGGATWCIAFCNTNFESITSDYETILAVAAPMTRTVLVDPQLKMNYEVANGTCVYSYGSVKDLACYGGYMYSESQSHVKIYAPDTSNSPQRILFHNLRAERGATKPDYSVFMTGASDGHFDGINLIDCFLDAHTYYIYQDSTVTGELRTSRLIMNTPGNAQEMKFNKVLTSQITVSFGNLTVDTLIARSKVTNYGSGTISLTGKDAVITEDFYGRLFQTDIIRRVGDIRTLADDPTPSVSTGNIWLTGGTTPITDLDDGVTGQIILLIAEYKTPIIDGTNIFLDGNGNFTMAPTDTLTLVCKVDNKWYEQTRSLVGTNETVTTGSPALTLAGITKLDSSGGAITGTLADGEVIGGMKTIIMIDASTSSTITVANHVTESPEVFTFAQVGDSLVLVWNGTDYMTMFNNGVSV